MIGLEIKTLPQESVAYTCLVIAAIAAVVSVFCFVLLLRRPALATAMIFSFSSVAGWLAASPFGNAGPHFSMSGVSGTWVSSAATLWFGGLVIGYMLWRLALHPTRPTSGSSQ